jgi:cytochrome P450
LSPPTVDAPEIDIGIFAHLGQEIPDLHERLAELRETRGVAYLRMWPEEGVYTLLRYADVEFPVKDEDYFSKAEAFRPLTFPLMGPNMQGYDGAEHTKLRSLVSPAFRRTIVPRYIEPIIRPVAEELVDAFVHRGECDLTVEFT